MSTQRTTLHIFHFFPQRLHLVYTVVPSSADRVCSSREDRSVLLHLLQRSPASGISVTCSWTSCLRVLAALRRRTSSISSVELWSDDSLSTKTDAGAETRTRGPGNATLSGVRCPSSAKCTSLKTSRAYSLGL